MDQCKENFPIGKSDRFPLPFTPKYTEREIKSKPNKRYVFNSYTGPMDEGYPQPHRICKIKVHNYPATVART